MAERVETQIGQWIAEAMTLPSSLKVRVATLVRSQVSRGGDGASGEKTRAAIKRLTDAFIWQAVDEADYREQLMALRAQLEKADRRPDERRIMDAIKVAQDLGRSWGSARPEQRRQLLGALFETVTIRGKSIVAVRPKAEVAPLLAAKVQSGGPDRGLTRNGEVRIHGVIVEQIEDLLELARGVA